MLPSGPPGGSPPGFPMPKLPLRVRLAILWYALRFQVASWLPGHRGTVTPTTAAPASSIWTILPLLISMALMLGLGLAWSLLLAPAGR